MTLNEHLKLKGAAETFLNGAVYSGQCPHLAVPCCALCAGSRPVWSLWLSPCGAAAKDGAVLDRPEVMRGVGMDVFFWLKCRKRQWNCKKL